jgi:predicted ABC-type ATPase
MIAGPNGSGKSTLTRILESQGIDFGEYHNADDIARDLDGSPEFVAAQAQARVRQLRQQAVDLGRDHTFETVLSHPSHIDHLRLARSAGFTVIVYFVATDSPLISVGRVANRVVHGGHDVPNDRIVQRYYRSIANLTEALAASDEATIFDNSSTADPMRALAIWSHSTLINLVDERTAPVWWRECLPAVEAGLSGAPE